MSRKRLSKLFSMVLTVVILMSLLLTGCANQKAATAEPASAPVAPTAAEEAKPVTLKLLVFSNEQYDTFNKLNIVERYKQVKPNVTLDIEKVKDSGEFEQAMKIRKTANALPDISWMKPYMLSNFKDALAPLNDLEAAKNNAFAEKFAVDGQVLGIPECMFNEFVWYKKSIFKEYNLSVPKTWDEFVKAAETIKNGGKYIPILMGGKDAWPDYPFNEFMPSLEANDGALWNVMATQDEPFTQDKPFYKSYAKIKKLYDAKVFGSDPLGAGFDQVKVMFGSKGAMIAAGQWFLPDAAKTNSDMSDVGTFFLPVRDNASDKLNTITMVDGFMSTPKDGKNVEESKAFINWYLGNDWYPDYMKDRGLASTVNGFKTELDPVFAEAYNMPDVNYVVYDGGNAEYKKIEAAVKFDVKKIGQEMMAGKNLDKMMEDLNKAWKAARASK